VKVITDYLKKDLSRLELDSWEEIRCAYIEQATAIVRNDWQSPTYLSSLENQAGRRKGTIIANINDYTRDRHDLAREYEKSFASEYLPRLGISKIEPFVTSSGMAALMTAIVMLHRRYGVEQKIMVGKHSYFQNWELLSQSFTQVISFDEKNKAEWSRLIEQYKPRAIFVDTLCNDPELVVPPIMAIAKYLRTKVKKETCLVVDNSLLSIGFPWKDLVGLRSRKLQIVGWESLNKYYQFGLDRVTGGVIWGTGKLANELFQARMHAGTILSDVGVAMLPSPNAKILQRVLSRVEDNRKMLLTSLGSRGVGAESNYVFNGAQVVIKFEKMKSYFQLQQLIRRMIKRAKKDGLQLAAGTSFGLPTTRVYVTARQTEYVKMFLRISVGVEDTSEMKRLVKIITEVLQ